MKSYKAWFISVLLTLSLFLICFGGIITFVDPYLHFHAPLDFLEYPLDSAKNRYINDGVSRHWEYNAIITGTSMTQNFNSLEFDELFQVQSIKIPNCGAGYKEINQMLERAIAANPNITTVIRGLDYSYLVTDKDFFFHNEDSYPNYLYDNSLLNDVNYIFNKSIMLDDVIVIKNYMESGGKTPDFNLYCKSWNEDSPSGKAHLDASYKRPEKSTSIPEITEADLIKVQDNVTQNITDLAANNPDIDFYYFFTPYSIYYWDTTNQRNGIEKQLRLEKEAIKLIVEYDNIHLFSFFNNFDLICDLNNYGDFLHYTGYINSQILEWMANGDYQLTKENYKAYCDSVHKFYTTYDYDAMFQ